MDTTAHQEAAALYVAVSAVSVISSGVAVAIGVAFILSAIFGFEIF